MCAECEKTPRRFDNTCVVKEADHLGSGYHRIRLSPAEPMRPAPGQFLMVRVRSGTEPLLRRPFSIHRYDPVSGDLEILFRVVGAGTAILTGVKEGDTIDLLGPLGRGFGKAGDKPILIGGGIGVAPLLFLAESLLSQGKTPTILLGGRSDRDLLCHGSFTCLAAPSRFATEDGSLGETGLVTELLARELERAGEAGKDEISVHSCGPIPMLAAVSSLCLGKGVRCEVSMESHMACGVGACLGCIVKSPEGKNLRVCREGPVFSSNSIAWP